MNLLKNVCYKTVQIEQKTVGISYSNPVFLSCLPEICYFNEKAVSQRELVTLRLSNDHSEHVIN